MRAKRIVLMHGENSIAYNILEMCYILNINVDNFWKLSDFEKSKYVKNYLEATVISKGD